MSDARRVRAEDVPIGAVVEFRFPWRDEEGTVHEVVRATCTKDIFEEDSFQWTHLGRLRALGVRGIGRVRIVSEPAP